MMSRKVPNQSFEVFIFAIGERRKILENKNKTKQLRREERTPDIMLNAEKMDCTSWVRHSGTKGLFPGARFLISKSTGL